MVILLRIGSVTVYANVDVYDDADVNMCVCV